MLTDTITMSRQEYADVVSTRAQLQVALAQLERLKKLADHPKADPGKQLHSLAFDGLNMTVEYGIDDDAVVAHRVYVTPQCDISELFDRQSMERLEAAIDRRLQAEWREDFALADLL